MQCQSCKEIIDDDSRYCDQCGEQIWVCSACGRPGKGKRCIFDGKDLVPATGVVSTASAGGSSAPTPTAQPTQSPQPSQTSQTSQSPLPVLQAAQTCSPTVQPVVQAAPITQPIQQAQPVQPMPSAPQGMAVSGKVKLTSAMHGIMIEVGDGDIIGRKNGAFANVFGRFNYVSGTHCKIVKTVAGWCIQDMGSTNHTFLQGNKLEPNMLYPLANGVTVKVADVELLVNYDTGDGGTARI